MITIVGQLPSLNEHIASINNNRLKGNRFKKINTNICAWSAKSYGIKHNLVHIDFHWIEPNKKRDKDNIAFAKKYILDGMVSAGIIPNDGWKNVDSFTDKFSVDKDNPRIEVTITEL